MTDRLAGFIVTLDHDIRDDDAAATIAAIQQIRGVLSVQPIVSDLGQRLWAVLSRGLSR